MIIIVYSCSKEVGAYSTFEVFSGGFPDMGP